jgi:hypothetical protein
MAPGVLKQLLKHVHCSMGSHNLKTRVNKIIFKRTITKEDDDDDWNLDNSKIKITILSCSLGATMLHAMHVLYLLTK